MAFLLKQQCANGGFRLNFTANRDATDQTCTDNAQAQTDTTAIAVQQLDQIPASDAITTAKAAARTYLENQQKRQRFVGRRHRYRGCQRQQHRLAAIHSVTGRLPSRPPGGCATTRRRTSTSATSSPPSAVPIALNGDARSTGRTNGITSSTADQWRRATAEALPVLPVPAGGRPPSAPVLTGPTAYVKAGAVASMKVSGVHAGDLLCERGTDVTVEFTATGATVTRSIRPPAGTATGTYLLRDPDGHFSTTSLKVLGARTLAERTSKTAWRLRPR